MDEDLNASDIKKISQDESDKDIVQILRMGVFTSAFVIVAGTMALFLYYPAYLTSPEELSSLIDPGVVSQHSLSEVFRGSIFLRAHSLIMLGLLILIATPVFRVVTTTISFAQRKDRTFTWITGGVLLLLLLSLVIGKAEG